MAVETAPVYSAPNNAAAASYDAAVPVDVIRPSLLNPRKHFDPAGLAELAESIKAHGILEPLVVRWLKDPMIKGAAYEIVCGERRWRAAKLAGLATVPVRNLGDLDDKTTLRLAVAENMERANLNPIEEAEAFRALNTIGGLKQAEIAAAVNRSQPTIANRMRLLELPADVQDKIRKGELSPAHGIALARHKEFPRLVEALATIAATKRLPSADLEGDPNWGLRAELASKGVVKSVERYGGQAFDMAVCLACPFGAYRNWAHGGGVCLKPSHWEELDAAAKAARDAKNAAFVAKTVEKAKAAGQEIPQLNNLPSNTYAQIDNPPPAGCTADCACRSAALHYQGKPIAICTDPRHYQLLKRRDTIAQNKARRDDEESLRKRMIAKVDAMTELDERALRIVAIQATAGDVQSYQVSHGLESVRKRRNHTYYGHASFSIKDLQPLSALDSLKLAVESILTGELIAYHEGSRGAPSLTRYFLGDEPEAAT